MSSPVNRTLLGMYVEKNSKHNILTNFNSTRHTTLPVLYYIVITVSSIILALIYGRLVVDPATYVIPDMPLDPIPLVVLLAYEVLALPWTYKYNKIYFALRAIAVPVILVAIILRHWFIHLALALAGIIILIIESKIQVEIAYRAQQVIMVLTGAMKGLAAILAGIYAIALVVPGLKDSIITITQFVLALTPFIILGIWLFTTVYTLTITREPMKFATAVAPMTLLAIVLAVLAFIYIQPALMDPKIALRTYGDITRALSLAPVIILLIIAYMKRYR